MKYQHFIPKIKVLLVTGGKLRSDDYGGKEVLLDSTEILKTPDDSWITTARLPSPRYSLRAGTVNNNVFIFGKNRHIALF